jgi:energy-converting hydrogenase Eha subunit G
VQGCDLSFALILTPLNFIGVLLVWVCWFMARRAFPRGKVGGVRIIRRGSRLRVRSPVITPLAVGMAVTGGVAFPLWFAVIIPFSLYPPTWLVIAALLFAYGAGIVAAIVRWSKIASLRVKVTRQMTGKGVPRYTYAPTLYLRQGDEAEAFTSWLRDRLRLAPELAKVD